MEKGNLTPRSNDTIDEMRFSGGFGQPDGFASVLTVRVNRAGEAYFTLCYRKDFHVDRNEDMWSVGLSNEQRMVLSSMLGAYKPTLYEVIKK